MGKEQGEEHVILTLGTDFKVSQRLNFSQRSHMFGAGAACKDDHQHGGPQDRLLCESRFLDLIINCSLFL